MAFSFGLVSSFYHGLLGFFLDFVLVRPFPMGLDSQTEFCAFSRRSHWGKIILFYQCSTKAHNTTPYGSEATNRHRTTFERVLHCHILGRGS